MTLSHKDKPTVMGEAVSLLPCPMCGSAARISMTDNRKNQPFVYIVGCSKCPICMDWQQTKVEAITAWNTRDSTNKDETIAKLREALEKVLESREAEARAEQVLDRQRRRHAPSSVVKESERLWIQAMARASDAESAARAALTSTKKEG